MAMDRRGFLKKAGLGSISMVSLSALAGGLPTAAWADEGGNGFTFLAQSKGVVRGVGAVTAVGGTGRIEGSDVEGSGTFNLWTTETNPATLRAAGTWQAERLVSFRHDFGTFGTIVAGIAELDITLMRAVPSPAAIPARLRLICNIGAANISTGEAEGFVLRVGDVVFTPFGAGLTGFSRSLRAED